LGVVCVQRYADFTHNDSRTARLRIALLLTSLGIGGAERQVISMAERLEARGHVVLLVTLMRPLPEEWPTRLPVVRLGMTKTPIGVAAALVRGRRVLREFNPDILHSHTKHANLAARLWCLGGAAPRVLSTLHNVREGGPLRMLIYRATDRYSVHTTAVSAAAAASFLRAGAVPREKCSVLTNAIDTDRFVPDSGRRARQRAELHAGNRFIWLAAGRAAKLKDYPNLLRAFSRVRAQEPAAELWIAGEGTESLPCAEGVRTFGLVRDMAGLLDAADGFVMSSAWEGMPLALGEAMAMEKPIVATRVGGIEELAGDCAALVAPANDAELAAAMLATMRRSQVERAEDGCRGRARMVEHFSWERKMQEWEALYAKLTAQ
jgi:glycosyltransferase involved in cell wall biosynthesis